MKATPKTVSIDAAHHQSDTAVDTGEKIRSRAYELYERRGRTDGHDLEDWLQAEAEGTTQKGKAASA